MKFSEKVKYARMKLLLTQEALAKELGVSYATLFAKVKELHLKSKAKDNCQ